MPEFNQASGALEPTKVPKLKKDPEKFKGGKATVTDKTAKRLRRIMDAVDMKDGSVVKFQLALSGNIYSYAALKVGGRWFTTGRTCPPAGYSREGFAALLEEGSVGDLYTWAGGR